MWIFFLVEIVQGVLPKGGPYIHFTWLLILYHDITEYRVVGS
jgi:hypothetical protein